MLPTRGPVAQDDPAFIHRSLELDIALALGRSEYVSIRGGRQTGKTTVALSLARSLSGADAAVAYLDLQGMRPVSEDALRTWLSDFLLLMAQSLQLGEEDVSDCLPLEGGADMMAAVLRIAERTERHQVVVMLDEITAAPLDLQPVFFSTLRALFNDRKNNNDGRALLSSRISFVLIGTFDPDKLIDDQNSPFNVSHDFDTADYDFQLAEVSTLCEVAGLESGAAARIHQLSGGHPYLTNALINRISTGSSIDESFEGLLRSNDPNLLQLASRLAELEPGVVGLLKKIANREVHIPIGRGVLPALDQLFSAGLIRLASNGPVEMRSRIYLEYVLRFQDTVAYLANEGIRVGSLQADWSEPSNGCIIGIVVALQEELAAVLEALDNPQKINVAQNDPRTYYVSTLEHAKGTYTVVVTLSMIMGNVESALAAKDLMHAFAPKAVLVVGIAAGIDPTTQRLGDVLVAESVYYYEFGKVRDGMTHLRPRMTPTSRILLDRAQNLDSDDAFSVHFGVIASGEQVIADSARVAEMVLDQPKLVGIEMESAGVCAAALGQVGRPEFITFRGISDFANETKGDDMRALAARNVASYMKRYLESGPIRAAEE